MFVKFYSPNCGHCLAMKAYFDEASQMFRDVDFGGVDCTIHDKLCREYNVTGYPKIILFDVQNTTGAIFQDHNRDVDGFCDFIEEKLTVKALRPPKMLRELDPINYPEYINKSECLFVTFYVPWCRHCKEWLPEAKRVAYAFQADAGRISIGSLNCDLYKGLCHDNDITTYPTMRLISNHGQNITFYNGSRNAADVVKWINEQCGSDRDINGMLSDNAGTLFSVKEYVENFINIADSNEIERRINEVSKFNASLYVKYMKNVVNDGIEKCKDRLSIMKKVLDSKLASSKVLDNIKRRYNVLSQVLGEMPFIDPNAIEEENETEFNPFDDDDDETESKINEETEEFEDHFIPSEEEIDSSIDNSQITEENIEKSNEEIETQESPEQNSEINYENEISYEKYRQVIMSTNTDSSFDSEETHFNTMDNIQEQNIQTTLISDENLEENQNDEQETTTNDFIETEL